MNDHITKKRTINAMDDATIISDANQSTGNDMPENIHVPRNAPREHINQHEAKPNSMSERDEEYRVVQASDALNEALRRVCDEQGISATWYSVVSLRKHPRMMNIVVGGAGISGAALALNHVQTLKQQAGVALGEYLLTAGSNHE